MAWITQYPHCRLPWEKGISGITQQGGARVAKRTARKLFEEAKAQLETAWRQWLARSKLDEFAKITTAPMRFLFPVAGQRSVAQRHHWPSN